MNIFKSVKIYAGKWDEKEVRSFNKEEVAAVERSEVIESEYGLSVCFYMQGGAGQTYLPLDPKKSTVRLGDSLDVSKLELVTLSKQGSDDIVKVRALQPSVL